MLTAGDQAPDFSLPDQDGEQTTLDALLGDGPLVLFFYPGDFTPICTREACMIRDVWPALATAGVTVAGVSPNDIESHARFRERHSLEYTLLADPGREVVRAFGVDGPFGIGVRRTTFLIDADKRIRRVVRADLRLSRHSELLREALAARMA